MVQTTIVVLDQCVFPIDETDVERKAHSVTDNFLENYARFLWPSHTEEAIRFTGALDGLDGRQHVVEYVKTIFRANGIKQGHQVHEIDNALELLQHRDPFRRGYGSESDLRHARSDHFIVPLSHRYLTIERIPEWNREQARGDAEEVRSRWHAFMLRLPSSDDECDDTIDDGDQTGRAESGDHDERSNVEMSYPRRSLIPGSFTLWVDRIRRRGLINERCVRPPQSDECDAQDQSRLEKGLENLRLNKKSNGTHNTLSTKESTWGGHDSDNETMLDTDSEPSEESWECETCVDRWFPDLGSLQDHQERVHVE